MPLTKSRSALLIFLVLFTFSCKKKDSDLGLNLRDDNGLIDAHVVDSFEVIAYTVLEDSVRTDSLSSNLLGAINDPIFGNSVASINTTFRLDELGFDFGTSPTFDSIVLSMVYYTADKFYGDTNSTIKLNVFRLNEAIDPDLKYYSNYDFATSDLIETWEGNFAPSDSVKYVEGGDTIHAVPQLRIKLNDAFGQSFIDNAPSIFATQEDFDNFFKGLVIVPDVSNLSVGQGAIAPFFLNSIHSNLTLYYNDTLFKEFSINSNSERVGSYDLSGWNTDIQTQLTNPSVNYEKTYLQAMGGLKTKIEIPELFELVKSGERIMINEAKLTFTIDPGSEDAGLFAPDRLLMVQPSEEDGSNALIADLWDVVLPPTQRWEGHTNYGGSREDDTYTFHFNRHLQQLLDDYVIKGEDNNRGFYLIVPTDHPITPARMVLDNSGTGQDKKIKLKIIYTKL